MPSWIGVHREHPRHSLFRFQQEPAATSAFTTGSLNRVRHRDPTSPVSLLLPRLSSIRWGKPSSLAFIAICPGAITGEPSTLPSLEPLHRRDLISGEKLHPAPLFLYYTGLSCSSPRSCSHSRAGPLPSLPWSPQHRLHRRPATMPPFLHPLR
jgi:hypothetical protein